LSHFEDLLAEYHDWRGYIVRRNIKVGRLSHGGWAGELDIVCYHPESHDLLHLEPSIEAESWAKKEARFTKKLAAGRKYIFSEVFPWLNGQTPLEQVAILVQRGKTRTILAGGRVRTLDEVTHEIRADICKEGKMASRAVSERYPLLRTIQLVECGYFRRHSLD
jgi:hypothetical protein